MQNAAHRVPFPTLVSSNYGIRLRGRMAAAKPPFFAVPVRLLEDVDYAVIVRIDNDDVVVLAKVAITAHSRGFAVDRLGKCLDRFRGLDLIAHAVAPARFARRGRGGRNN